MNWRGSQDLDERPERLSILLVLGVWVLVRVLQVRVLGLGTGQDVGLYLSYAQHWSAGAAPYTDFSLEYPPGALPVFVLPLLVGGAVSYAQTFAIEMACFDVIACVFVLKCAELRATSWLRPVLASWLYTLVTATLYPVLYARFDLVPAVLVLGALYFLHQGRLAPSGVLLGAAGAVKLWPFALVPIWLAWAARRGGTKRLASVTLCISVGALLAALPALPRARWGALSFLKFHTARGIQLETTWAAVALALGYLGLAQAQPEHNFGAFHVAGRVPSMFAAASLPVMVAFALVPQIIAIARGFRDEEGGGPDRAFDHAALGGVLGFMIAGKVLSPQFMLWIAPLLPLAVEGLAGFGFALAIGALTTAVYPYLSHALEQRAPGHGWALLMLGSRNLLLLGWYWVAVYRTGGEQWGAGHRRAGQGADHTDDA
jgi:hypothetical protein